MIKLDKKPKLIIVMIAAIENDDNDSTKNSKMIQRTILYL